MQLDRLNVPKNPHSLPAICRDVPVEGSCIMVNPSFPIPLSWRYWAQIPLASDSVLNGRTRWGHPESRFRSVIGPQGIQSVEA